MDMLMELVKGLDLNLCNFRQLLPTEIEDDSYLLIRESNIYTLMKIRVKKEGSDISLYGTVVYGLPTMLDKEYRLNLLSHFSPTKEVKIHIKGYIDYIANEFIHRTRINEIWYGSKMSF